MILVSTSIVLLVLLPLIAVVSTFALMLGLSFLRWIGKKVLELYA